VTSISNPYLNTMMQHYKREVVLINSLISLFIIKEMRKISIAYCKEKT